MTSIVDISISINGKKESARLICDSKEISLTLERKNFLSKIYKDTDFYKCFGRVRQENPGIQFLCKGAKINVHPSSMSSQMSLGLKAYELMLGKEASLTDVVYIFDYDETNLTNNPEEQRAFYLKWIDSEK